MSLIKHTKQCLLVVTPTLETIFYYVPKGGFHTDNKLQYMINH